MRSRQVLFRLLPAVVSLCGCVGEGIPFDSSDLLEEVVAEADARVVPGQTPRSTIQAMLGRPLHADEALKLEVYRKQEDDEVIGVGNLVPFPAGESTLEAYILIVYDEDWRVEASDALFISEPSPVGRGQLREHAAQGEATAGGFTFGAHWKDRGRFLSDYQSESYLFGPYEPVRERLGPPPAGGCAVYVASAGEDLRALVVDGVEVPDTLRSLVHDPAGAFRRPESFRNPNPVAGREAGRSYLARLLVPSGKHAIRAGWMLVDESEQRSFSCAAGEERFVRIEAFAKGVERRWSWRGYRIEGFERSITVTEEPSPEMRSGDLLVWIDGQPVDETLWKEDGGASR